MQLAQLHDVGKCPPPSFWRFVATVGMGQLAAFGTGLLTARLMRGAHPRNIAAITTVSSLSAFWLGSGIMWLALERKRPDTRIEPDPEMRIPGRARGTRRPTPAAPAKAATAATT